MVNPLNPFSMMLLLLIFFQTYSVLDANKKIWCVFRRVDKTKIAKWAKSTQARIEFDGGWYQIEGRRITTMIKWLPLPTVVKSLDFTYGSTLALDPDTFDTSMSPEARKQLDKTDDIRALEGGNNQALKGASTVKLGAFQQYMPIVMLVGFLVVGWMLYQTWQKIDLLGFSVNVVQEQLGKVMQNGGIK